MTRSYSARRAAAVGAVCAAVALAGACSRNGGAPSSGSLGGDVVAQVGEARLTAADLERLLPLEIREGITGTEIRDVVDRWVRTEVLYQAAGRMGIDKDATVAARLLDLQRELLADEVLQRELSSRVRLDNEEIHAYYRAHTQEYTQEVQVKHILLNTREEAEEILQQLNAGAAFEALAQQHSVDMTAARGGDLGFLNKDAMNPAFRPYVFDMQIGEHVGPIVSSFGFHVVKVVARRDANEPVSFDAARDEIMHALLLEKQQAAQAELLNELSAKTRIQIASTYAGMSIEAGTDRRAIMAPSSGEALEPLGDTESAEPDSVRGE